MFRAAAPAATVVSTLLLVRRDHADPQASVCRCDCLDEAGSRRSGKPIQRKSGRCPKGNGRLAPHAVSEKRLDAVRGRRRHLLTPTTSQYSTPTDTTCRHKVELGSRSRRSLRPHYPSQQ
jgi:hypothetical protein